MKAFLYLKNPWYFQETVNRANGDIAVTRAGPAILLVGINGGKNRQTEAEGVFHVSSPSIAQSAY